MYSACTYRPASNIKLITINELSNLLLLFGVERNMRTYMHMVSLTNSLIM